jgi:predicted nuclease of predicted toxin-antitoxin system
MKFIVDAHLPKALCDFLREKNYDVIHTSELQNKNQTTDEEINSISINENRILITKDSDFYYSYIIKNIPYKLILLRIGNCSRADLIELFKKQFFEIEKQISANGMIEVYKNTIEITE